MKDRHEWTDDLGEHNVDREGLAHKPWPAALQKEILRLAARVRELEEVHAKGAAYITLLEERVREVEIERDAKEGALHMAVARLGGLVEGHPTHRINFLQRIDALVREEARIASLAAIVAPLLPLFRERAGAWASRDRRQREGGWPPIEHPDTITLTAEFPVSALRALCNSTNDKEEK